MKENKTYIKINIKYSKRLEFERVFNVCQKIDWYKKMGYRINLPKNLEILKTKRITEKDIKNAIGKEYDAADYKKIANYLKYAWRKKSGELTLKLLKYGLKPKTEYKLFLTKYGTGGSYESPNKIILNIFNRKRQGLLKTIIHEIIHLIIHPLIEKYKTNHWQKERIVDLILNKIGRGNKMQKIPVDVKTIDKVFNKFFPDIEKIIKNVK